MSLISIVIVIVALGFSSGAGAQESWKDWMPQLPRTEHSYQNESARQMLPESLRLRGGGAGSSSAREPRVLRVRVYAANDFRRQTLGWQERFGRVLARVNALTRGWPGVRFEVVEWRNWEKDSTEPSMERLLDELAKADAGDDVDLVVGLVAALPVFPGSIDNLGMARMFSRHFVMRSLHELAEHDFLRKEYDALSEAEREALLAKRKVHKEQVVFLHEWAHTLGVIHAHRPGSIVNPHYDRAQTGFSDEEAELIEIALRHRAGDGPGWLGGTREEFAAFLADHRDPAWEPRDRDWLVAAVTQKRAAVTSPKGALPNATPPTAASPNAAAHPLDGADAATFGRAVELERAGRYDQAWSVLAPLESRHARDREVRGLLCRLAWRRPPDAARVTVVEMACRAAAEIAPAEAQPQLYLADAYLTAKRSEARASLERARELLDADTTALPETWQLLAGLLERASLPTLAERAARHADGDTRAAVAVRAAAMRRRVGLPGPGEKQWLTPAEESDYIHAVEEARAAFGSPTESAAIDAAVAKAGAPVASLLRCEAALKARRLAAGRSACRSLLAASPSSSLPSLLAAFEQRFGAPPGP
jgi:hypothetical protein